MVNQRPRPTALHCVAILLTVIANRHVFQTRANAAEPLLDCTVSGEFADVAGVTPWPGCYHLFNLGDDGAAIPSAIWKEAFDRVGRGEDVWLDIEPDVVARPEWQRPVDPSKAPLDEIKQTHAIIAEQLGPLCDLAKQTGAKVWVYGMLSPTYTRVEDIVNDPSDWLEDCRKLATLKFDGRQSLAELLHSTGGGVLYEVYIPTGWNRPEPWAMTKCVLLLERQAASLQANGIRGIPLLNLTAVGGNVPKPVRPETMQALIFTARGRGPAAIWNGYHPINNGTKPLTSQQKALFK